MIDLFQHSIEVIRNGQSPSGAYVASPTFSQYGYSWLRDGAWIAYGMDAAEQHDSATAFYRWGANTLMNYKQHVDHLIHKINTHQPILETDYLPTRFHLDGTLGSEEWPNFQLDGYGAWLWGLVQHCTHVNHTLWQDVRPAVELVIRYLEALWHVPNYDCWEEHRDHIHTASLSAIYGGLCAVKAIAPSIVPAHLPETIRMYVLENCVSADGHFVKFIGNDNVDASLLWVAVPYGLVDVHDPRFMATLEKIERDIHRPTGGVYRYSADTYFGGGEWLLLATWLASVYVELKQWAKANALLKWVEAQASPNGDMPEQVADHALDPSCIQPWIDRWGTSANPLLWSHGMYILLKTHMKAHAS